MCDAYPTQPEEDRRARTIGFDIDMTACHHPFPTCNTSLFPYDESPMNAADLSFDTPGLHGSLAQLGSDELDRLDFGVIGFDAETNVSRYNSVESDAAGLTAPRVVGQPLFTNVAPCLNNFLVAQRFEDAGDAGVTLDDTIDYVLTLRMRPVKVKLRLLAAPGDAVRYVLVQRKL
jgi:photoactive yellow protein